MKQNDHLDELFDLTNHPGWKYLVEDLEKRVDALKEGMIQNPVTEYQIGFAQGHVKVFREMIGFRQLIEIWRSAAKEDAEDEANVL